SPPRTNNPNAAQASTLKLGRQWRIMIPALTCAGSGNIPIPATLRLSCMLVMSGSALYER
ncbi:MAG: hypothetical protein QF580_05560, partial [Gammaproteobacteria bacterium]|nr:hypothetical protein [Gammaproteobacteria bacterium]